MYVLDIDIDIDIDREREREMAGGREEEEEKKKVMATAQQILKSLKTSKDDTEDMIAIFSNFDHRLSNLNVSSSPSNSTTLTTTDYIINNNNNNNLDPKLQLFVEAEDVILNSDVDSSFREEYLAAVDDVINMMDDVDMGDRAEGAVQVAMTRLEDEFRHILIRNTMPLDTDQLYGSVRQGSLDGEIVVDFSSFDEEEGRNEGSVNCATAYGTKLRELAPDTPSPTTGHEEEKEREGDYCFENGASLGDDVAVELVAREAVMELKEIANRMIRSGYERECCQVYTTVRQDVLDECLSILGVEKLSIEEVQKIEWRSLDEKMNKWMQAIKIVVRVLLNGEKQLCEEIFDGSEVLEESCFLETAKGCVLQLLNFGEAVAIGKRSSEKLFRILDMYDVMMDVSPELQYLFGHESGESVCSEAQGVLDGLGEAVIGTFVEFEKAVQGESTRKPTQGGEIHPLTRYVMNYVKLLVDYSDSLNVLLQNSFNDLDSRDGDSFQVEGMSPVAQRLLLLLNCLESNLEEKSKMYEDSAMQYVFLMNNILYIVQKVKDSDLGKIMGDNWVRKHRGQVRQHATSYLRASWSKTLSCLKDEGIGGSSGNASKVVLKERFKSFNASFEEIYRVQTGWKVPDDQLREELRISISEMVLPAYRSFLGRFRNQLESGRNAGKYIKYTVEDLENYVSELFEGTPAVTNHLRRKSG